MPTIAYISQFLPRLTETFVYREIEALRQQGFEILTLSIKTPDPENLSAESLEMFRTTRYFAPLKIGPTLAAQLHFLFRRPWRYLSTLAFVLSRPGEPLAIRRRTFGHFIGAAYHAIYLKQHGADHIHAHFSGNSATYAFVISRLLDISFSFTAHNSLFVDQLILKPKIEAAKFIVSISGFTSQYIQEVCDNRPEIAEKIHIIRCGIEPEKFAPRPTRSQQESRPLIFSVARMDPRKGLPYLVDACHILHQRGIDFRCVIGGDGEQMDLIQQKVAEYNLENCVELPGFILQETLQTWLDEASMLILPCIVAEDGDVDGIPVTLMEAMAKQIPVISTAVSGIPELIEDGVDGLLVEQKDAEALADGIQTLLEDWELAQRVARSGREKVVSQFDVKSNAEKLANLFRANLAD